MSDARPSRPLRSALWAIIACACSIAPWSAGQADPPNPHPMTTAQPPLEAVPATPGKLPPRHTSSRVHLRECGRAADARALQGPERSAFIKTCIATRHRTPPPQNTASR